MQACDLRSIVRSQLCSLATVSVAPFPIKGSDLFANDGHLRNVEATLRKGEIFTVDYVAF